MEFSPSDFKPLASDPKQSLINKITSLVDTTQLFVDFTWEEIRMIASYMQAYEAETGKVLFMEGDPGGFACLISDGRVDIFKTDHNGKRKKVTSLGAGKILGEMSLIDEEPRSATCVVAKPSTLVIITRENFLKITADKPKLGIKMLLRMCRLLSQRLRQASGLLTEYLPAEETPRG
jgi:CRP/FNR family transcriptional regulator, cyclic AMP receptor protein